MIFNLYKQRGETPLECIRRFKDLKIERLAEKKDEKMTYLGRLDPLAEGVLLVGSGEDTSQASREKYFGLDKDYEFIALFGFATDTYDVMGKVLKIEELKNLKELELIKLCKIYEGEREQKYPEYSSKMIASRNSQKKFSSEKSSGRSFGLNQTFSPENFSENLEENFSTKRVTIHKLNFLGLDMLSNKELFGRLLMDIGKVKGDFRQAQILNLWKEILLPSPSCLSSKASAKSRGERSGTGLIPENFFIARFSAHVSSGTYIRSLVNDFGNTLGVGATTLSIRRTRVGDYRIEDSLL